MRSATTLLLCAIVIAGGAGGADVVPALPSAWRRLIGPPWRRLIGPLGPPPMAADASLDDSMVQVGIRTLQPGEDNILAMEADGEFLYVLTNEARAGNSSFPFRASVVKLRRGTLLRANHTVLDIGATRGAEAHLLRADSAAGHLYVGTRAHPMQVLRLRSADLSARDALHVPGTETAMTMEVGGGALYVLTYGVPSHVLRYSTAGDLALAPSTRSSLVLGEGEKFLLSSTQDDADLYAASSAPTLLLKLTKGGGNGGEPMAQAGAADVGTFTHIRALVDGGDGFLYAGTEDSPGRVLKLRKSDMTVQGSAALRETENMVRCMGADGRFLYVVTQGATAALAKLRKSDLGRVGGVTVAALANGMGLIAGSANSNGGLGEPYALHIGEHHVYLAMRSRPGRVLKLTKTPRVDCLLSPWGPWAACTASCDGGLSVRNRTVVVHPSRPPEHPAGTPCNALGEQRACATAPCSCNAARADGGWAACDAASGVQPAVRPDARCPPSTQSRPCDVDCVVGELGPPGPCLAAGVHAGNRARNRTVSVAPRHRGKPCPPLASFAPCDVDCALAPWSEWGACQSGGVRRRDRAVRQMTMNGGAPCGPLAEFEDCARQCEHGQWSAWHGCVLTMGDSNYATQTRLRELEGVRDSALPCTLHQRRPCPVSCAVAAWGDWDSGCGADGLEHRGRNITRVEANGGAGCPELGEGRPCPVNCKLGEWSTWDACDDSTPTQTRLRLEVPAKNGGAACKSEQEGGLAWRRSEERACPCSYGERSAWSTCSVTCGGGTQARTQLRRAGAHLGAACPIMNTTSRVCGTLSCDSLPCKVSAWSGWSGCQKPTGAVTPGGAQVMVAVTCGGGGRQSRARIVLHRPAAAGMPCPAVEETRSCAGSAALPCPQKCALSTWSSWSDCLPVANAVATRTRTVKQYPVRAPECGQLEEERVCAKVNCVLSNWGTWSDCSSGEGKSAGLGRRQSRTRAVMTPPRGLGSVTCGDLTDWKDCVALCAASAPPFGAMSPCTPTGQDAGTRSRVRVLPPKLAAVGCAAYEKRQCAVSCAVALWGKWGPCDVREDRQRRSRHILAYPQNGGASCPPAAVHRTCVEGCVLTAWGGWSPCNAAQNATHARLREVARRPTAGSSYKCGALRQSRACPLDCAVTGWSEWGPCSATTALRERRRAVVVAPRHGGAACPLAAASVSHNGTVLAQSWALVELGASGCGAHCPAASVTRWGAWSKCLRTGADAGMQLRSRKRVAGAAAAASALPCPLEQRVPCAVACAAGQWGRWSACDKGGTRRQSRTREIEILEVQGGGTCPHLAESELCVIDCEVSAWTPWSACDREAGRRSRTRSVTRQERNGGYPCGALLEAEDCNVDCELSDWSGWTPTTCKTLSAAADPLTPGLKGSAQQQRRSRAVKIASRNGGNVCPDLTESRDCGTFCNSMTTAWGSFGECATGGTESGVRERTRERLPLNPLLESRNKAAAGCHLLDKEQCVVACELSVWGAWEPDGACKAAELKGAPAVVAAAAKGAKEHRSRMVLTSPMNGGASCGETNEARICGHEAAAAAAAAATKSPTPPPSPALSAGGYLTRVDASVVIRGVGAELSEVMEADAREALGGSVGDGVQEGGLPVAAVVLVDRETLGSARQGWSVAAVAQFSVSDVAQAQRLADELMLAAKDGAAAATSAFKARLTASGLTGASAKASIAIGANVVERQVLGAAAVAAAPAYNGHDEPFDRALSMTFRAGGYTLSSFGAPQKEAFAAGFAQQLGVPRATVAIGEVHMEAAAEDAEEGTGVSFVVDVRCTKLEVRVP